MSLKNWCLLSSDRRLNFLDYQWKNSVNRLPYSKFSILSKEFREFLGTMPVTSCTSERSFSSVKLIKTYFRTTITSNCFNPLAIFYVHRDIHPSSEDVLQKNVLLGPHKKFKSSINFWGF